MVASCGLYFAIDSMSPVSATTVVYFLSGSRSVAMEHLLPREMSDLLFFPRLNAWPTRTSGSVAGDAVRHSQLRRRRRARRRTAARRESTRPSTTPRASCAARRRARPSGASARHSAWLPCVAPLVQEPRPRRAVGLGGQRLGALVGRRPAGRCRCPAMSCGMSSAARARRARSAAPRVGARAALVAGHVEARRAAEAVGDDRVEVGRGRAARGLGWRSLIGPRPLSCRAAAAGRRARTRRDRRRARAGVAHLAVRCGGP